MNLLSKLKNKLIYWKYKLFPETFDTTGKGDCVAEYCRKILDEQLPDDKKIDAYEDIISEIQKSTKSSRIMAVIYILSVLGEVQKK